MIFCVFEFSWSIDFSHEFDQFLIDIEGMSCYQKEIFSNRVTNTEYSYEYQIMSLEMFERTTLPCRDYSSSVSTIFRPPSQTTCLGPWPRGYGDYFFLADPCRALQPCAPPPPAIAGLAGLRHWIIVI